MQSRSCRGFRTMERIKEEKFQSGLENSAGRSPGIRNVSKRMRNLSAEYISRPTARPVLESCEKYESSSSAFPRLKGVCKCLVNGLVTLDVMLCVISSSCISSAAGSKWSYYINSSLSYCSLNGKLRISNSRKRFLRSNVDPLTILPLCHSLSHPYTRLHVLVCSYYTTKGLQRQQDITLSIKW